MIFFSDCISEAFKPYGNNAFWSHTGDLPQEVLSVLINNSEDEDQLSSIDLAGHDLIPLLIP
jgi:hypothetical protein